MDVGSVFLGTGADPNSWSEPLNSIWRRSLLLWHVIGKSCKKQGLMWGDKVSLGPVIRLADGWPKPMAPQKTTTWHENASGNNGIVKKANTKTKHSDIFGQNFARELEDKNSAHWTLVAPPPPLATNTQNNDKKKAESGKHPEGRRRKGKPDRVLVTRKRSAKGIWVEFSRTGGWTRNYFTGRRKEHPIWILTFSIELITQTNILIILTQSQRRII